jgi:hypothetical protein
MKSSIKKKLLTFVNHELPLIQHSGLFSDSLTLFGKFLTTGGKIEEQPNRSVHDLCA